jgi:hypothetical protein
MDFKHKRRVGSDSDEYLDQSQENKPKKVLITDIFFRKTFDFHNIIKARYKEYSPILAHRSVSLYSRFIIWLVYSSKAYKLRKSSYDVFEKDLIAILNHFKDSEVVYVPVEEDTTQLFYQFISKNFFPNLYYNLPDERSFATARDKKMMSVFCRQHKIPVPAEYTRESLQQLQDQFKPIVAKPRTGSGASGLIFVEKKEDLDLLNKIDFDAYIVQEKIQNMRNVQGAFFLFDKGKCISYYGHRRIRTFPPSGGVTVFSAFDDNQTIKHTGISLLEKLNWSGFAMIEFLYDGNTDTYKIIEINPRLWGSFILSEFSGTGFLQNYFQTSLGKPIIKQSNVRNDVYIRWFFPFDLINYVISFGRIENFWKFNRKNTCFINFSYSRIVRSLVAIPFLYFFYIKQFFKQILGFKKN